VLPGQTIVLKEHQKGWCQILTKLHYCCSNAQAVLSVSYIGMEPREVQFGNQLLEVLLDYAAENGRGRGYGFSL